MIHIWKNKQSRPKPQISLTARLLEALCPGSPALFLYNGELIRTSAVQAILEAAPDHVRFETANSIYRISCDSQPQQAANAA